MISKTPDCEPWGQEIFGELSAGSSEPSPCGCFWREDGVIGRPSVVSFITRQCFVTFGLTDWPFVKRRLLKRAATGLVYGRAAELCCQFVEQDRFFFVKSRPAIFIEAFLPIAIVFGNNPIAVVGVVAIKVP